MLGTWKGPFKGTCPCHLQVGETQGKTTKATGSFLSLGWVGEGESNPPAAPATSTHHDSRPPMCWERLNGVIPSSPLAALSRTACLPILTQQIGAQAVQAWVFSSVKCRL